MAAGTLYEAGWTSETIREINCPMIGIALIGAGRIGHVHARNIVRHSSARLVAVADPVLSSAQAIASPAGAIAVANALAAIGTAQVDAVVIASPTNTHVATIAMAAKAGKAILCEKPIDLHLPRVDECHELLTHHPVPFMLAFNRRFDPSTRRLHEAIQEGRIGQIEHVLIISRDPAPPPHEYIAHSGGIFRDMLIHDFDQIRFLTGAEFTVVHATGTCLFDRGMAALGDFDTATVTASSETGLTCSLVASRRSVYGFEQRTEVFGALGMLALEPQRRSLISGMNAAGGFTDRYIDFFPERYADAYRAELDHFVAGVLSGASLSPTVEDGRRALALANAADMSARTGHPVRLA